MVICLKHFAIEAPPGRVDDVAGPSNYNVDTEP